VTVTAYPNVFASYETERAKHKRWVRRHYIDGFNLEPSTMLDAGCGEGFWADLFADYGFTVAGLDLEAAYIEAGREKYPRLHLFQADAETYRPVRGLDFDVVLVKQISHLYQPDLDGAARVIRNLLPHGRQLLVTAYTDGTGEDRPGQYSGTFRHHSVDDLDAMIRETGTVRQRRDQGRYHTWQVTR
jgi:SAM-dependent methyltransferase